MTLIYERTISFLGTGGSTGTPMIACTCPVCTSTHSKNKRLRPSGFLTIGDKKLLIDAGPDFRYQALHHGITEIDGVLLTHTHFDHVAGLDELRIFYLLQEKVMPMLVSRSSLEDLKRRYDYLFREKSIGTSLAAQLLFEVLEGKNGHTQFQGIDLDFMTYEQGGMEVNGYRFGNFAYISDIKNYDESIFETLQGVEILVLSSLRRQPSPMHLTFDEAIAFSKKAGAKETYFTHLSHRVDHEAESKMLPPHVHLAYDGLTLEFNYEPRI